MFCEGSHNPTYPKPSRVINFMFPTSNKNWQELVATGLATIDLTSLFTQASHQPNT